MPREKLVWYTAHPDLEFEDDSDAFTYAYLAGKPYVFPLDLYQLEYVCILTAREKAAKSGTFVEAKATKDTYARRYFFDDEYGAIKLHTEEKNGLLRISGAIFNPKKGDFTFSQLKRLIEMISAEEQKPAIYTTYLINRTQHLKDVLSRNGFHRIMFGEDRDEFQYSTGREYSK